MIATAQILPARSGGRGTARRVVEGYRAVLPNSRGDAFRSLRSHPSTMLRMVPLPTSGEDLR